jgi:hypothetical protein
MSVTFNAIPFSVTPCQGFKILEDDHLPEGAPDLKPGVEQNSGNRCDNRGNP